MKDVKQGKGLGKPAPPFRGCLNTPCWIRFASRAPLAAGSIRRAPLVCAGKIGGAPLFV